MCGPRPPNLYYLPPLIDTHQHLNLSYYTLNEFFIAHLFLLPEDGARCGHFGHIVEETKADTQKNSTQRETASGRGKNDGNLRPRGGRTFKQQLFECGAIGVRGQNLRRGPTHGSCHISNSEDSQRIDRNIARTLHLSLVLFYILIQPLSLL